MVWEPQLYEIGLLIKPELSEVEAAAELGNVRSSIEKSGGILERTTDPKLRKLSYAILKNTQAYFAALQFYVSPASLDTITKEVKSNLNVLRHLILLWTREPTQSVLHRPLRSAISDSAISSSISGTIGKTEKLEEKVDEKELDKKLEEILGN